MKRIGIYSASEKLSYWLSIPILALALCAAIVSAQEKPITISSAADQQIIDALQSQVEALQHAAQVQQKRLDGCFAIIAPNEVMAGQQQSGARPVPSFTPFKQPEVKK